MLKTKALIPALLLSGVVLAPASALPGKLTGAAHVTPMQMTVADRDRDLQGGRDHFGDRDRDRDKAGREHGDRTSGTERMAISGAGLRTGSRHAVGTVSVTGRTTGA